MFDCHAHLTDPSLREGLDDILAEAEAAGVSGIVSVSETLEDAVQVFLTKKSKIAFPSTWGQSPYPAVRALILCHGSIGIYVLVSVPV